MHAADFSKFSADIAHRLPLATITSVALRTYLNCRNRTHGHLWLLARWIAYSGTS
jgi:hypothetical protein